MLLTIAETLPGLHPSEVVAVVDAVDGRECFPVDRRSIVDGRVEIGHPVGRDGDHVLVELPNETTRGSWRIAVPTDRLEPSPLGAAA